MWICIIFCNSESVHVDLSGWEPVLLEVNEQGSLAKAGIV